MRIPRIATAAAGLALIGMANAAMAALVVDSTVTPIDGGLFRYQFSITNTGPDDIILVTISGVPLNDPNIQTTLEVPAGFVPSYDPNLGLVDFVENTALFRAGTTVEGFAFNSGSGPGDRFGRFEAFTDNFDQITAGEQIFTDQFEAAPGAD